jgi:hypothetical protein
MTSYQILDLVQLYYLELVLHLAQNLQIDNKGTPQEELRIGKQIVELQEKGKEISGKEKRPVEYKDAQARPL